MSTDSVPTFGFANDTGEPLIFDIELDAWRDAAGAVTWASECRGVTLAQTVPDKSVPERGVSARADSGLCEDCGEWYPDRTWGVCPECFEQDAETDTPTGRPQHWTEAFGLIQRAEDRAAKRGRDEALAVVVKALLRESEGGFFTRLADRIEREQGGSR